METKEYRDRLESLCQEIIEDIRAAVLATPDHMEIAEGIALLREEHPPIR